MNDWKKAAAEKIVEYLQTEIPETDKHEIFKILTTCAPPVTNEKDVAEKWANEFNNGVNVMLKDSEHDRLVSMFKHAIRDCAPPVSSEVVEAARQAAKEIEYMYGAAPKEEWPTYEMRIKKVAKIIRVYFADAGTCRCDCEKYRELLEEASGHLDWVLGQYDCLPATLRSEKTIERQKKLEILVKKIAALGAEEEKK